MRLRQVDGHAARANEQKGILMSNTRDDGGPAFPVADFDYQAFKPGNADELKRLLSGMTLRDYFAAKAMPHVYDRVQDGGFERVAKLSYELADAMLKARQQ
jgi:hypothetical protein